MTVAANLAALVLFVYYAVSFTKVLVAKLSSDPSTSNGIVRIWALILGLAGAIGDYLMTAPHYDRLGIYTELKLGAAAAIGAIITYHIGQSTFMDAFDTAILTPGQTTVTTVPGTATVAVGTLVPATTTKAEIVTPTPAPLFTPDATQSA